MATIGALIRQFLKVSKHGHVVTSSGVITTRNPDTVRAPDVSYYSKERVPDTHRVVGYCETAPDLCVEVLSVWNAKHELREKIKEYFAAGVRMVWVVEPEDRSVTVYTWPDQGRAFYEPAELSGGEVLPGFCCRMAELFE